MAAFFKRRRFYYTLWVIAITSFLFASFSPSHEARAFFSEEKVKINPVPAAETSTVIRHSIAQKAPTIVFVFASWCPVCKRNFPVLIQVAEKYKSKGLRVVALSVDRNKSDLTKYLAKQESLPFTPYFIMQRFPGDLQDGLATAGIHYNGSIPYVALMDENGRVLGQGNYSIASVDKVLQTMLP